MFILTEATSDPSSLKFLPGRQVLARGTLDIRNRAEAAQSPLAAKLFDVPGIAALSFGSDYITVAKQSGEWKHLKPALLGIIMEYFMSGAPIILDVGRSTDVPASKEAVALVARIRDALRGIIDPELGYNIVDLGLIYDVSISDGAAFITMTTTTPGCPATSYLTEGARECTASVAGVETAEITLTHDPRWSTDMMSDDAKAYFGITDGGRR